MLDLGFITEEDKVNKCIDLTKAMYENIGSPLTLMKTFSKHLMEQLKLKQSMIDTCIFYKIKNNEIVLILAVYAEVTLCLEDKEEWDGCTRRSRRNSR
jgi:hypothetical protein